MANIFKEQKAVNEHPNRNNFDLSKKSNLSMKFGTLYPVYCQPVVPGDSFSIDTAFNLKLQPVVFPVQSKMRAHMHYFYVRNKNLWSNWENWISNLVTNTDHPHPYISLPDKKFKSGSIHDYLGVPTSVIGVQKMSVPMRFYPDGSTTPWPWYYNSAFVTGIGAVVSNDQTYSASYPISCVSTMPFMPISKLTGFLGEGIKFTLDSKLISPIEISDGAHVFMRFEFYGDDLGTGYSGVHDCGAWTDLVENDTFDVVIEGEEFAYLKSHIPEGAEFFGIVIGASCTDETTYIPANTSFAIESTYDPGFDDYSEMGLDLYSNHLHINALPYRAYESIYYCYYNNNVLNPLKISGQVQYNRYNTNLGDGADTTDYHLFQRNYELDFLTSSLPSPQQGVAPVVGMTALGDITIEDENGITTAHATIDNDGTISKVVLTSPAASNEHARTAMNIASCGMSISDFRQTNALQRFLETNIRKGYRYMDFIAGHFGKEPEYRELDLPEFIGGFSRDVSVSTVVSNADTLTEGSDFGAALGQYGGYAQVVGGSKHSVRHYCDDYGFIIGILSVVPTPCYSQLLPKHMVAPDNFLDYYFPEFSSSGLQPITYKEVCPIQSYVDSFSDASKSLEDTFGYQRPNYDMVSAVDELHGDFRGSLSNYVINRRFDGRPELGQSFISINPSEINDIFVDTNPDDDTIIGEIGFAVHAKRPVPRVVIPNLGK